tara:strand:+ start:498 stop:935 length:438 start_codon:yes stop_codon:yes gene_type:complete
MEHILKKFKYPESLIAENNYWYILLRPDQSTYCSMILISKDAKNHSFSNLNINEQEKMFTSLKSIEKVCYEKLKCEKINFLAYMMIDPIVHFHIFPRYKDLRVFENINYYDPGFPGVVDLNHINSINQKHYQLLVLYLRGLFNEE